MAGIRYSTREAPSIFHIVCRLSLVLLVSQFFLEKERECANERKTGADGSRALGEFVQCFSI